MLDTVRDGKVDTTVVASGTEYADNNIVHETMHEIQTRQRINN